MAIERYEAERRRRALDHADRPVPRPWHPDHVLVADRHRALLAEHFGEAGELRRCHAVGILRDGRDQLLRTDAGLADPRPVDAVEQRADASRRMLHLLTRGLV